MSKINIIQELKERLSKRGISLEVLRIGNEPFLTDHVIFNRIAYEVDDMRGFIFHTPKLEPVAIQGREILTNKKDKQ